MSDFLLIVDWWVSVSGQVWSFISQYWFLIVPIGMVIIFNILGALMAAEPSNKNR